MPSDNVVSFDEKTKQRMIDEINAEVAGAMKPMVELMQRRCRLMGGNPEETLERCGRFQKRVIEVIAEFSD